MLKSVTVGTMLILLLVVAGDIYQPASCVTLGVEQQANSIVERLQSDYNYYDQKLTELKEVNNYEIIGTLLHNYEG